MTLQHHQPDGQGGLEPRRVQTKDHDWRTELRSPRWGVALQDGRLPELRNPEMNPTGAGRSMIFWLILGGLTFAILVAGYGTGFWSLPA